MSEHDSESRYQPSEKEINQALIRMSEQDKSLTEEREIENGAYGFRGEDRDVSAEVIKNAEAKGEEILEIPVQVSYTIKIPRSALIKLERGTMRKIINFPISNSLENLISEQIANVKELIKGKIVKRIKEDNPELFGDSIKFYSAIEGLSSMIEYKDGQLVRTDKFDTEKADRLAEEVKDLLKKHGSDDNQYQYLQKMVRQINSSVPK